MKKINHGEGIEYSGKVGGRTAWELVIREGLPEVVTFQLAQEWDSESESKEQFKKEKTSGNEWPINGEKQMNGEEKMNLWSFHSRREPHIHPQRRHPRFLSANPTGLAMHFGKLAFPPTGLPSGIQSDSVTDTVTDSSLLSSVKLGTRWTGIMRRKEGQPKTFCANVSWGTTSPLKGMVAICKLLSCPRHHQPTLISCSGNKGTFLESFVA